MKDKDIIEKTIIIDCHSHLGQELGRPNASLKEYLDVLQKQGIAKGIVMSVPSPVVKDGKRIIEWSETGTGKLKFENRTSSGIITNPYAEINEEMFDRIKGNKNLFFVPLIHPVFDTAESILDLAKKYDPIALKIHGVAAGISPMEIDQKIISALRELNLPVIIHTAGQNNRDSAFARMENRNLPFLWAAWCEKNHIKGYLAHGARLCNETFNVINNNPDIVVGLGPDLHISDKMMEQGTISKREEYLQRLKDGVHISKILFDVDYNWNTPQSDNAELDCQAVERVKEIFYTPKEQQMVLSQNAISFFGNRLDEQTQEQ